MDPAEQQAIGQKIRAAQELGLEVTQEYSLVNGSFFTTVKIRKGDTEVFSHPVPTDKSATIKNLEDERAAHQTRIAAIDAEIDRIKKLKEAPDVGIPG